MPTDKRAIIGGFDVNAQVAEDVRKLREDVATIRETIAAHKVWFTVLGFLATVGTSLFTAYLVKAMH
jgi:hypothetical protein